MRHKILFLLIPFALALFLTSEVVAIAGTSTTESAKNSTKTEKDVSELSDRKKWSHARTAYKKAKSEEKKKHTEAAAKFYEQTLQLLGSMDLAAVEIPTKTVIEFQRQVLKDYDHFLASLETLPENSSPMAVIEAITQDEAEKDKEEVAVVVPDSADRDQHPIIIKSNKTCLPDIPHTSHYLVEGQINFFEKKGRKVMNTWMERAAYIFPRLRPILHEEGMPEDLIYLAMIESGLNTKAYSYAHASGLWQFIPGTGKIYGLEINRTYDERRHVEEATRAACRYLRTLYEEFGDWYLVFASYNCGEGRIRREVKKYGHDYWNMRKLPRQTRGYVPIFLAAREICKNPAKYGFPPLPREVPFECERIWTEGGYALEDIARVAGHDPQAVADMNPEFTKGVIPKSNHDYMVRLPGKPKNTFNAELAALPKMDIPPTTIHVATKGETLKGIAKRYGTTVTAIKAMPENKKVSTGKVKRGQPIVIPLATVTEFAESKKNSVPTAANSKPVEDSAESIAKQTTDEVVYTVHRGESLGKIARQLGVSVDQICRENKIRDASSIYPGQRLKITVQTTAQAAKKNSSQDHNYYVVRQGDTVFSIAQAHGKQADSILKWNKLSTDSTIYPGQKLVVGVK